MNDDIMLTVPNVELTVEVCFRYPLKFDEKHFVKYYGKKINKKNKKTTHDFVRVLPATDSWSGASLVLHDYARAGREQCSQAQYFASGCMESIPLQPAHSLFPVDSNKALDDLDSLLELDSLTKKDGVYQLVYGDVYIIVTVRVCV